MTGVWQVFIGEFGRFLWVKPHNKALSGRAALRFQADQLGEEGMAVKGRFGPAMSHSSGCELSWTSLFPLHQPPRVETCPVSTLVLFLAGQVLVCLQAAPGHQINF